jgi:hypothetical protein
MTKKCLSTHHVTNHVTTHCRASSVVELSTPFFLKRYFSSREKHDTDHGKKLKKHPKPKRVGSPLQRFVFVYPLFLITCACYTLIIIGLFSLVVSKS